MRGWWLKQLTDESGTNSFLKAFNTIIHRCHWMHHPFRNLTLLYIGATFIFAPHVPSKTSDKALYPKCFHFSHSYSGVLGIYPSYWDALWFQFICFKVWINHQQVTFYLTNKHHIYIIFLFSQAAHFTSSHDRKWLLRKNCKVLKVYKMPFLTMKLSWSGTHLNLNTMLDFQHEI